MTHRVNSTGTLTDVEEFKMLSSKGQHLQELKIFTQQVSEMIVLFKWFRAVSQRNIWELYQP
jgi:hypothetical protein